MGKKDLIDSTIPYKMNVSQDIVWGITRRNNAFLYKDRYTALSADPFNADNRHNKRNCGFAADGNRVGLTVGTNGKLNVSLKNRRRFVNAAPKLTVKGEERKGNTRSTPRNYNFSTFTMHDKNAMNVYGAKSQILKRRIAKLHRANNKAARNTKAASS